MRSHAETDDTDLFDACKRGDLEQVKLMVDVERRPVNVHNVWNATPLFYACLCGHLPVVQFLLDHGARCEPTTFDGDRALYGALNDDIRTLLRQHKVSRRQRDPHSDCFRSFFLNPRDDLVDVRFLVHGEEVLAHRSVLSARCQYFGEQFRTRWKNKTTVNLRHRLLNPGTFRNFLLYLYSGSIDLAVEEIDAFAALCKQCRMYALRKRVLSVGEDALISGSAWIVLESVSVSASWADTFDMGTNGDVEYPLGCRDSREWPWKITDHQRDLSLISDASVVSSFWNDVADAHAAIGEGSGSHGDDGPATQKGRDDKTSGDTEEVPVRWDPAKNLDVYFPDVVFVVDGVSFYAHRFVFCGRSEYFNALLTGHFKEATLARENSVMSISSTGDGVESESDNANLKANANSNALPVVDIPDVSPIIFASVVAYVYSELVETVAINADMLFELLKAADRFLLPNLKNLCVTLSAPHIATENVCDFYTLATMFNLDRLEHLCVCHFARNLDAFIENTEFHAIVVESASTIRGRQAVDSVPILDDIRAVIEIDYEDVRREEDEARAVNEEVEMWLDEFTMERRAEREALFATILQLSERMDEMIQRVP